MIHILRMLGLARPEIITVEFPLEAHNLGMKEVDSLVSAIKAEIGTDSKVIVLQHGATLRRS